MKENNFPEFDEFDFSDDKTVKEISEKYPVLSDIEKDRIYKESEKKYEAMVRENDEQISNKKNNNSQEIQYHTSQKSTSRKKFLEIAACLLITAGIVRAVVIPLSTRNHQGSGPVPYPAESTVTQIVTGKEEIINHPVQTQISQSPKHTDATVHVTTAIHKQTVPQLEEQMKNAVIPELMRAMYEIDKLETGHMNFSSDHSSVESSDSIIENDQLYSCVNTVESEKNFSGVSEIREYIHRYMTDRLISEDYSNLVDGEHPRYIEQNNKLYGNPYRACSYFLMDESKTNSFTFELQKDGSSDEEITSCKVYIDPKYDDSVYVNGYKIVQIDLVLSDGLWKMDQFVFNDHADTYSPVNDESPDQIINRLLKVDTEICDMFFYGSCYTDSNDRYTIHENDKEYITYYRVTDKRYSDMAGLEQYLKTYYTDNMFRNSLESSINNYFREFNGMLYSQYGYSKSSSFCGWSETPVEITNVTETSFTARNEYYEPGYEVMTHHRSALITCVKETDGWKIDSMIYD